MQVSVEHEKENENMTNPLAATPAPCGKEGSLR